MSRGTLRDFEEFLESLTERYALPQSGVEFRDALAALPEDTKVEVASVAIDYLRNPELLRQLVATTGRKATQLLQVALRANELRHAVDRLQELIDTGAAEERLYQDWCDDHSWVFGGAHQLRDLERRIDAQSTVDLMLPDIVGYRDIVELKRPDAEVLRYDRSHNTFYFSNDVGKAMGQVHKYMDRLHDLAREGLARFPHIFAYHPRATIVIGRSEGWPTAKTATLRGLNQRLHGIDVMTYDHLLMRARSMLANLAISEEPDLSSNDPASPNQEEPSSHTFG
jgi:hypothetical protein